VPRFLETADSLELLVEVTAMAASTVGLPGHSVCVSMPADGSETESAMRRRRSARDAPPSPMSGLDLVIARYPHVQRRVGATMAAELRRDGCPAP
jgi:hypothetical protein